MLPSAPRGQYLRTKAAPGPPTVAVSVHLAWCHSSGVYPLPHNHSCDPTPHKWTGIHTGLLSLWNSTPLWPWPYRAIGFLCPPSFRFLGTNHCQPWQPQPHIRFSRSCLPSSIMSVLPPPTPQAAQCVGGYQFKLVIHVLPLRNVSLGPQDENTHQSWPLEMERNWGLGAGGWSGTWLSRESQRGMRQMDREKQRWEPG